MRRVLVYLLALSLAFAPQVQAQLSMTGAGKATAGAGGGGGGPGGAITVQAVGTLAEANGATSDTVDYPASVAAGEYLALLTVLRANDGGGDLAANYNTQTTPAAFTLHTTAIGGTGAWGGQTGLARATLALKVPAAGTETGSETVSWTNSAASSFLGVMMRLSGANAGWQTTTTASGQDTTAGASWSVTAGSNLDFQPNDLLIALTATTSEDGVASTESLSASGITFGTVTRHVDQPQIGGFRSYMHVMSAPVSSGSGTVAPTAAITFLFGVHVGTTLFIRVRNNP